MAGVLHGVEVIEVPKELVEAVHSRQKLVLVAQVVLAELTGGITHRSERGGNRRCRCRQTGGSASLTHRRHASAYRQLAGDEVRPSVGAACFGIIIGEKHPLGGDLVQVRS